MKDDRFAKSIERLVVNAAVRASHSLSELLNDEIRITNCQLDYGNWREALLERLKNGGNVLTINQTTLGAEPVRVSLVIDAGYLSRLVNMLMGRPGAHSFMDQDDAYVSGTPIDWTDIDALTETTNIVTGSCAAVLGPRLGLRGMSVPALAPAKIQPPDRLSWLLPDSHSMCADSRLKARRNPLEIELIISIEHANGAEPAKERPDGTRVVETPDSRRLAARQARS